MKLNCIKLAVVASSVYLPGVFGQALNCTIRCATGFGEPHFRTWDGTYFDFHGGCDVVMIRNAEVDRNNHNTKLDMHLRLTVKDIGWSQIDKIAVRITSDGTSETVEFPNGSPPSTVSGYPLTTRGSGFYRLVFDECTSLEIEENDPYGLFYTVRGEFPGSSGLGGTWNKPGLVLRNESKTSDGWIMGENWQVGNDSSETHPDPELFATAGEDVCTPPQNSGNLCLCQGDGQSDEKCPIYPACVTENELSVCGCVNNADVRENCRFDIGTTGDVLAFEQIYCVNRNGVCGDPHFKTWSGDKYDFHGVCDLVFLKNPDFNNGLGMDIHIRTKKTRMWSYIDSAVIRIGRDTLEVKGGTSSHRVWVNKVQADEAAAARSDISISGYPVIFKQLSPKARQYDILLGNEEAIVIKTWNKYVSVHVKDAHKADFGTSLGMMGTFPHGIKLARDGSTRIDDVNVFGQEWQVLEGEAKLFHTVDGPQSPEKCDIPSTAEMRRRLGEALISKEDAELACSRVSEEDFDLCVFDVMATNDKESVGAY